MAPGPDAERGRSTVVTLGNASAGRARVPAPQGACRAPGDKAQEVTVTLADCPTRMPSGTWSKVRITA